MRIGCSYLWGILGALTVFMVIHFSTSSPPKIATVNVTGLIDQYIEEESKKKLAPEILQKEVKAFGKKLEKNLKRVALRQNVVLLPREAVIAGSPDYTALIRQRLIDYRETKNE